MHSPVLYAHIAGGALTAVLGPLLLGGRSRRPRLIRAHRWLGRVHVTGSVVGALAGPYVMCLVDQGGQLSRLGVAGRSAALAGVQRLRLPPGTGRRPRRAPALGGPQLRADRELPHHSIWVVLLIAGAATVGLDPIHGRRAVDWLSWSANLLFAEVLIRPTVRR